MLLIFGLLILIGIIIAILKKIGETNFTIFLTIILIIAIATVAVLSGIVISETIQKYAIYTTQQEALEYKADYSQFHFKCGLTAFLFDFS